MFLNLFAKTRIVSFTFASCALLSTTAFFTVPNMAIAQAAANGQNMASADGSDFDAPIPQPKFKNVNSDADLTDTAGSASIPKPEKAVDTSSGGQKNIGLATAQRMAQKLADKFSKTRYMIGEFIQFDARGNMTRGRFFLQRPGRILFDYKNAPLRVISDGRTVAVNNRQLHSWNTYRLDKSPLNLLLADRINIANGRLIEFTQNGDKVTLVLGDQTGRASIDLTFNAKTSELEQWVMNQNGQRTTIQIFNTRTDIEFPKNMFDINYYRYPPKRK